MPDLLEDDSEIIRRTCDRRRTERCDTVARERSGDASNGTLAIERVVSVKTVHMYIDETGSDVAVARVDDRRPCQIDTARLDRDDASTFDNQ